VTDPNTKLLALIAGQMQMMICQAATASGSRQEISEAEKMLTHIQDAVAQILEDAETITN